MKSKIIFTIATLISVFAVRGQQINTDSLYIRENYEKSEHLITMRDGIQLYTIVYIPKDHSKKYPILLNRTCYNVQSYADYKTRSQPSDYLVRDKYILVYQDVRGRYMSEGTFDNMRPNIPGNDTKNKTDIDESSDTWDTIDWLIKNIQPNNGRVGMYGISYPGFYTAAAIPDAHPALKASSPQAPIADFFFDDFHHMGAFCKVIFRRLRFLGIRKKIKQKRIGTGMKSCGFMVRIFQTVTSGICARDL
jgi:uncharacterized protein